jgi:hypothetical protein
MSRAPASTTGLVARRPTRPKPSKPLLFLYGGEGWHPDPRRAQWLPSVADAAQVAAHYEGAFPLSLAEALAAWEGRPNSRRRG